MRWESGQILAKDNIGVTMPVVLIREDLPMLAFLSNMNGMEKIFAVCAIVGGVLFIIRLVLQFMGGDFDVDGTDGLDGLDGADIDADFDANIGDTDYSFKLISFQGLTAFFAMFGLVGLAMLKQSGFSPLHSVMGGLAAGVSTVWVMKKIFEWAMTLQSSGNIKLKNAIGAEGTVYLTIHAGDTGKVRINIQNHLKVLNAKCDSDEEIKTGEPVRVVRVMSGSILVVEKID
jgi:membrane protein implicated in regulation of membrane protease activity